MTIQLSSFLGYAQGKMLCDYGTEFHGYREKIILHNTATIMSFLDIHGKIVYTDTNSNEFLGYIWENTAYRYQQ